MTDNVSPAPSRRARKKRETRRKIFQAAIKLMAERGFEDVTITEVCEEADVANATFYLHFPTKASLVAAFNDDVADNIANQLSDFSGSSVEKLELLRALMANEWARHPSLMLHMLGQYAAQPNGALMLNRSVDGLAEMISAIVRVGQARGEIRAGLEPGIVAQSIMSVWNAVMVELANTGDVERANHANRQALDLILYGAAMERPSVKLQKSAAG